MDRSQITFTIFLLLIFVLGIIKIPTSNAQSNGTESDSKVEDDVGKAQKGSMTDDEVVQREEEAINIDGLNVAQIKELRKKAERFSFQADVDRMMKLIINSLYKNKEVFLRELISNASDALDKLRLQALTSSINTEDLVVKIRADKNTHCLHIIDTGIGMTKKDLIDNLGTIAKSGTSEFLAKLAERKSTSDANDLIGQFGVGFYSAFLVADRVTVISKHDDDPDQHIWESDSNSFSIVVDPRGPTLERGTEVILHLKTETFEYLINEKLKSLTTQYSQFINFPIYIWGIESNCDNKEDTTNDSPNLEKVTKCTKNEEEMTCAWLLVNENKPIWRRNSADITEDEYNEFYKSFEKRSEGPLAKVHFTAEGEVTFRSILFVPQTLSTSFHNDHQNYKQKIKLYVKRVFITDDSEDFMPKYLTFVTGVIDSDDLPLNVSRETLQQDKILKVIKKKLVHKVLGMLSKMNPQDYEKFWKEFSGSLKLGVMEDTTNKTKLLKLLRYWSSYDNESMISLDGYVSRMKKNQKVIYYIIGQSKDELSRSPLVEKVLKRGFEVIYMIETIDEYVVENLTQFEDRPLQNLSKDEFKLDENELAKERKELLAKKFEPLTKWLTEVLKKYIEKAEISERLDTSPCAIVASSFGITGNMEKIVRSSPFRKSETSDGDAAIKVLEINPRHPLIKELGKLIDSTANNETAIDFAMTLYEFALLRSGYNLPTTVGFAERIDKILRTKLNIPLMEKVGDDLSIEDLVDDRKINEELENKTELREDL